MGTVGTEFAPLQVAAEVALMSGRPIEPTEAELRLALRRSQEAEAASRQREACLRLLIENAQEVLMILELDGRIRYESPAVERMLGHTPEEMVGTYVFDYVHPDDEKAVLEAFIKGVQTPGASTVTELRFRHRGGEWRVLEITGRNLLDDPRARGVVISARDITGRKEVESALRESEERYRQLTEFSPEPTIVHSDGRFLYVNPAAARLFGAEDPAELLDRPIFDVVHPDYHDAVRGRARLNQVEQKASPVMEQKVLRLDGEIVEAEVAGIPVTYLGRPAAQVVFHDVTARKQAEAEVRRQAARAEALVAIAAELNAELDLDSLLQTVCRRVAQALNAPAATITLIDHARQVAYTAADHGLAAAPDVHTAASVALARHGELIGSLNLVSIGEARRFTADELSLLQGMADQAAQAIVNARLFERAERRLSRTQALRNVDIAISASLDLRISLGVLLQQVLDQLDVDAADILLLKLPSHTVEYAAGRGFRSAPSHQARWRFGEGIAGRVALERQTVQIPDLAAVASAFGRNAMLTAEGFVAYCAVPLIAKGQVKGVLEVFHRSPLAPDQEWLDFLEALAGQAAIAIDNAALFEDLQRTNSELFLAYETTLEGWSAALDLRDKETEGHTQRVTEMTLRLARRMNLSDGELVHVRRGALLHDIGKMGIPDAILHKPGKLSEEEWEIMRRHPAYAYDLLSTIDYLRPALDIPRCHHEKWDGTGYPQGLKAEEIPLCARLFAVVDVWDALRSDRPYRPAWSEEKVREHIRSLAGTHFDPQVVDVFLDVLGEWGEVERPSV